MGNKRIDQSMNQPSRWDTKSPSVGRERDRRERCPPHFVAGRHRRTCGADSSISSASCTTCQLCLSTPYSRRPRRLAFRSRLAAGRRHSRPCLAESSCLRIEIAPISGIQTSSISQFLVHALVEIRVLRGRAVSASRSHQFQGYKPCQYPKSSCTHSLKSVSCGVELSPHRDRTNFRDTNRVDIPNPRARTR